MGKRNLSIQKEPPFELKCIGIDCLNIITYKNWLGLYYAKKRNRPICKKCKYYAVGGLGTYDFKGDKNPFAGKKHTKKSKSKIGKYIRSESQKELARQNLKKVTNTRAPYDIWLEKYGKKEADKKLKKLATKHSKNNSGKNNPMYGKPSPTGSGNGWSGWYKNWYFRSLLELSYFVKEIENNKSYITVEGTKYQIPYIDPLGHERTYYADFLVDNKFLIECKPKKLWNTPLIKAKELAAIKWCIKYNLVYQLVDCEKLPFIEIKKLYDDGHIKWLPRYQIKYENWIIKNDI